MMVVTCGEYLGLGLGLDDGRDLWGVSRVRVRVRRWS